MLAAVWGRRPEPGSTPTLRPSPPAQERSTSDGFGRARQSCLLMPPRFFEINTCASRVGALTATQRLEIFDTAGLRRRVVWCALGRTGALPLLGKSTRNVSRPFFHGSSHLRDFFRRRDVYVVLRPGKPAPFGDPPGVAI